jgi:nucleotide-binding universal stress UspA family protein
MQPETVIAAVDLGPSTARVLHHGAAFARLLGARLRVLYVDSNATAEARERVLEACLRQGPYEVDFDEAQVVIRTGRVSEGIAREAAAHVRPLIVMGSRGRGSVARLVLGSTSEAVLRNATAPVLLVPPVDIDIVSIGDRVVLTCGTVLAAVDLAEECPHMLEMASRLAYIAEQPLKLLTVARARVSDRDATEQLRRRARGLQPVTASAVLVGRGSVANEISRCAVEEGAGLVVMGLRATPKCQPGTIATAVLKTSKAFVLAVPSGLYSLEYSQGVP